MKKFCITIVMCVFLMLGNLLVDLETYDDGIHFTINYITPTTTKIIIYYSYISLSTGLYIKDFNYF